MTVVDASAVVGFLLRDLDLAMAQDTLSAPHLIDSEVVHVLRRLVSRGRLTPAEGDDALDGFGQLVLRRWPVTHLVQRMWTLRHNLSGYDATYVALAESLRVPLITADRRLSQAPGLRCRVEMV